MTFYTQQCINSYRAGWEEEHPDEEPLDDATVISCLRDERESIIEKLVDNDLRAVDKGSDLLTQVLLWGFEGYQNLTNTELWEEMSERGLDL